MRHRTCIVLSVLLTLTASPSFAQRIYWTDQTGKTISRGEHDGVGAPQILFDDTMDGIGEPRGIAVDGAGGFVFWTDVTTQKLQRGTLDGTGAPVDLFTSVLAQGLDLDVAGGKMYWVAPFAGRVQVGNSDGSGAIQTLFNTTTFPRAVAVDVAGGKIYWAIDSTKTIERGNIDGSGVAEILFDNATDGLQIAQALSLDVAAGKIYWVDGITQKVQRGNMDGTGAVEDLFDNPTDGIVAPFAATLDIAAGKIYWTTAAAQKIQRGNMDGTGAVEDLFDSTDGLNAPLYIALDLPPLVDTITPSTTGPTNATSVDFTVTFSEDVVNFDAAADVVITHTGTASTGVNITGGPQTYTVSVTGITGDGSFTLAASTFSDILDPGGNPLESSVTSAAVIIDSTLLPIVFVDFAAGSPGGTGEQNDPVDTVGNALGRVQIGGSIRIDSGSSPETLTIERPVFLERNGTSGTVFIGSVSARSGFVSRPRASSVKR